MHKKIQCRSTQTAIVCKLMQCTPIIFMTHWSFSVILSSHIGNLSQVRLNLHQSWPTDRCNWHRLLMTIVKTPKLTNPNPTRPWTQFRIRWKIPEHSTRMATFQGMPMLPVKHSLCRPTKAWLPKKCEYQTDNQTERQTSDRALSCYALQAAQIARFFHSSKRNLIKFGTLNILLKFLWIILSNLQDVHVHSCKPQ